MREHVHNPGAGCIELSRPPCSGCCCCCWPAAPAWPLTGPPPLMTPHAPAPAAAAATPNPHPPPTPPTHIHTHAMHVVLVPPSRRPADSTPLLIFPEGTCVNNEYCVMFKRGAFDLGAPGSDSADLLFPPCAWPRRAGIPRATPSRQPCFRLWGPIQATTMASLAAPLSRPRGCKLASLYTTHKSCQAHKAIE